MVSKEVIENIGFTLYLTVWILAILVYKIGAN